MVKVHRIALQLGTHTTSCFTPAITSTSVTSGFSAPTSENRGCVELVLDTVSGVGLIDSCAYRLSACFCPSLSFLSARLRRRIADGLVDFNCCANCGLRAASDPYCVVHCRHGVVVVRLKLAAAAAVRAPVGAAARDLSARRDAPLRSMLALRSGVYSC